MRVLSFPVLLTSLIGPSAARGAELEFLTPLALNLERTPSAVATGDLNADGKLDLIACSSGGVELMRQDPVDRTRWEHLLTPAGTSPFLARAADLDGDGFGEVVVADLAAGVWLLRNQAGVLLPAQNLPGARATRWVTLGDWNGDGRVDLATANFDAGTVSIYRGDATGGLVHAHNHAIPEPHAIEGFDPDGDGDMDLALGHGDHGVRVLENRGDGTFTVRDIAQALPPCGRYVYTGELDGDGKDDLVLTCLRNSPQGIIANTLAAISRGTGEFDARWTLVEADIATAAIADLTGDGHNDIVHAAINRHTVSVYGGAGDGTFTGPRLFGPTDSSSTFVIADDLDGDGLQDVVTADLQSTLTVFWGTKGDSPLRSARVIRRSAGTASAIADVDRDGLPDFVFPAAVEDGPRVEAYLQPGGAVATGPHRVLSTPAKYDYFAVADLNGDGVQDMLGANSTLRQAQRVLLTDEWQSAPQHASVPLEGVPSGFVAGPLDGDATIDAAVLSITSNTITLLLSDENGDLRARPPVATLERPRLLALGDVDMDGAPDLVSSAPGLVGVHFGAGNGELTPPAEVLRVDPPRSFINLALGDVTGDGRTDIVLTAPGAFLKVLAATGQGEFSAPLDLKLPGNGRSIDLVDVNGDGRLDITTANVSRTFSVVFGRAGGMLDPPVLVPGAWPDGSLHRMLDLTGDGALDVAIFGTTTTLLFEALAPGAPPRSRFRRGDADWSGKTDLSDAVAIVRHLFQGDSLACEDPGDADDSGRLAITDAVVLLSWLFQGAPPPPAPGPQLCGEDAAQDDELTSCARDCE